MDKSSKHSLLDTAHQKIQSKSETDQYESRVNTIHAAPIVPITNTEFARLHIRVAAAHLFIEGRLDKRQLRRNFCFIFGAMPHQSLGRSGELRIRR
jgi:hypothetical protein